MEDLPAWFGGLPGSLEDEPPDYENKNSLATDEPEVTCLACAFDLTLIKGYNHVYIFYPLL